MASPFSLHLKKWKSRKLGMNIEIHVKLVSCNFHFRENRKVFILMIWGLMEITGNPWKPSVWCRGCPQMFCFLKNTYPYIFCIFKTSRKLQTCEQNLNKPYTTKKNSKTIFSDPHWIFIVPIFPIEQFHRFSSRWLAVWLIGWLTGWLLSDGLLKGRWMLAGWYLLEGGWYTVVEHARCSGEIVGFKNWTFCHLERRVPTNDEGVSGEQFSNFGGAFSGEGKIFSFLYSIRWVRRDIRFSKT